MAAEVCRHPANTAFFGASDPISLFAAAETGKWSNLKRASLSSPESMKHAVQKVKLDSRMNNFWFTDRGICLAMPRLVVDFRVFPTNEQYARRGLLDVPYSFKTANHRPGYRWKTGNMIAGHSPVQELSQCWRYFYGNPTLPCLNQSVVPIMFCIWIIWENYWPIWWRIRKTVKFP